MLLLLPTFLAFKTGGYLPNDQQLGLAIVTVVLAVVAVAAPWPLISGRWALLALGGLTGLAAWTALSISWARLLGWATDDSFRLALYATAFAAALIVMRVPRIRRVTPGVLLFGIAVVAVYALGGRLLPELIPTQPIGAAGTRLAQPVTYWNGEGFLFGVGIVLALACASDRFAPAWVRAAACGLTVPIGFACFLTLSRGAFIAVIGGLFVLLVMRPWRSTVSALVAGLAPTALLIVSLVAFDAPRTLVGSAAEIQRQGRVLVILALAATGLAAFLYRRLIGGRFDRGGLIIRPRTVAQLTIGVVVVIIAGTILVSYSSEQTEDITTSGARLGEVKTYRGPYWKVAVNSWAENPVIGVGSGSYQVEWRRERDSYQFTYNAHSLYLETLAELGLVGGLLLVVFFVAVIAGMARATRAGPGDPVLPAAAAVFATFAIHVAVDWDWELPAVTLPVLLLIAAALAPRPEADIHSAA